MTGSPFPPVFAAITGQISQPLALTTLAHSSVTLLDLLLQVTDLDGTMVGDGQEADDATAAFAEVIPARPARMQQLWTLLLPGLQRTC